MNACELRVDAALAGQRLDQALAALTPELGLRGRRRLIARGAVLVGGMRVLGADLSNGLLSVDLVRPEPERVIRKIDIATRD